VKYVLEALSRMRRMPFIQFALRAAIAPGTSPSARWSAISACSAATRSIHDVVRHEQGLVAVEGAAHARDHVERAAGSGTPRA
jgi:hypothetical protein